MLKTAQFIDSYYPVIDGVIQTVYNYAFHLSRLTDYCCVVAPKYGRYQDDAPFDVFRTAGVQIPFVGYSYALPGLGRGTSERLRNAKLDLFHAHSPFSMGHYALRLGRELHVPVITTFHSKYYDDFKRITKSERIARFVVDYIVKYYEAVDAVWSVNQSTAATLRDYGYRGEVFVIGNGIDLSYPDDAGRLIRQARERFRLPEDKKLLLFTGQLIWQKNLKLILDTVKLLSGVRDDFLMLFVGSGYHEKAIKKYADELGVSKQVCFLGRIEDRALLQGVYGAADLFFFPSLYDTFALVVREAALMKLPTLCSASANAAEGITDGENGFIEQPEPEPMFRRLNALLDDAETLTRVGERASATIPVPWSKVVADVAEQYRRVCAEYRAKHALV